MTIRYAEGYSPYYQHPIRPFTEEKARKRHEARQIYSAIFEENGRAVLIVEMLYRATYCNVTFLDELGRWGTYYSFVEQKPGQLFLRFIGVNTYDGTKRLGADNETTTIEDDGRLKVVSSRKGHITAKPLGRLADLSAFYEQAPSFGQYDSLIRRERGVDLSAVIQDEQEAA